MKAEPEYPAKIAFFFSFPPHQNQQTFTPKKSPKLFSFTEEKLYNFFFASVITPK